MSILPIMSTLGISKNRILDVMFVEKFRLTAIILSVGQTNDDQTEHKKNYSQALWRRIEIIDCRIQSTVTDSLIWPKHEINTSFLDQFSQGRCSHSPIAFPGSATEICGAKHKSEIVIFHTKIKYLLNWRYHCPSQMCNTQYTIDSNQRHYSTDNASRTNPILRTQFTLQLIKIPICRYLRGTKNQPRFFEVVGQDKAMKRTRLVASNFGNFFQTFWHTGCYHAPYLVFCFHLEWYSG